MISEEEFTKAYDALADHIFRHCYYRVFSHERAKELMQETFLRAWKVGVEGEEIRNLRAFLYKVANNLIIDESRKKKELSLEGLQTPGNDAFTPEDQQHAFDPGEDPTQEIHAIIDGKEIIAVLNTIDQPYRDAVIMRYIDELTPREIAEITGETANTISVRIHRGVEQLRTIIEKRHL